MDQQTKKSALKVLEETSRTFFIPISRLPPIAMEAVASAYLCLRAIDEIEDDPVLDNQTKAKLLRQVSFGLQKYSPNFETNQQEIKNQVKVNWHGRQNSLPQVTLRLNEWINYCPVGLRARVADCTAAMADRMAFWAQRNWCIKCKQDLDSYTFAVAGAVGLLLCEVWEWFEGVKTSRDLALGYGRSLQSVNILRNGDQDSMRGVSFYPPGWTKLEMLEYSKSNLKLAQIYVKSLPQQSAARLFCTIPLALAQATIAVMEGGKAKLTREQVIRICKPQALK